MNWLGLFVKQPVPGRVKTRLAETLGPDRAADLYAGFTGFLVERLRTTGDQRALVFTPNDEPSARHFESLAGNEYVAVPQEGADLGERLTRAFDRAFDAGADRVVVIGSDCPLLPPDHVERAFDLLAERDVVLGPAADGGYYLVGLARPLPGLFERIDWSGPHVLRQTIDRLREVDATLGLLPPWYDVDTAEDLAALRGHVAALRAAGETIDLPDLD